MEDDKTLTSNKYVYHMPLSVFPDAHHYGTAIRITTLVNFSSCTLMHCTWSLNHCNNLFSVIQCLLHIQQFQTLLILFPKFFAFFPQGTCALPVSSLYLVWYETYHMICTLIPKSVSYQLQAI